MVDETVYGRVTPERFDEILARAWRDDQVFVPCDTTALSLGADAVARRHRGRGASGAA